MSDGAGKIRAEESVKAIIGGEQPKKEMDMVEFERYVRSAPDDYIDGMSYDDGGRAAAKIVLAYLERKPERVQAYYEAAKKDGFMAPHELMDAAIEEGGPSAKRIGSELTGFMVGWAINSALAILEMPPWNVRIAGLGPGD